MNGSRCDWVTFDRIERALFTQTFSWLYHRLSKLWCSTWRAKASKKRICKQRICSWRLFLCSVQRNFLCGCVLHFHVMYLQGNSTARARWLQQGIYYRNAWCFMGCLVCNQLHGLIVMGLTASQVCNWRHFFGRGCTSSMHRVQSPGTLLGFSFPKH